MTSIGSRLSWPLLFIGLLFQMTGLLYIGIILFSAVVLFQLVTLPVEIDASRRALALARSEGIVINDAEAAGARGLV